MTWKDVSQVSQLISEAAGRGAQWLSGCFSFLLGNCMNENLMSEHLLWSSFKELAQEGKVPYPRGLAAGLNSDSV